MNNWGEMPSLTSHKNPFNLVQIMYPFSASPTRKCSVAHFFTVPKVMEPTVMETSAWIK